MPGPNANAKSATELGRPHWFRQSRITSLTSTDGVWIANLLMLRALRSYVTMRQGSTSAAGASTTLRRQVTRATGRRGYVRTEADRIDPLQRPERLSCVEPKQSELRNLDPFMPRGMNAQHPPP